MLAWMLLLRAEISGAEVSGKPQQLLNALARQLPENGLPAPADLLLDGETLRISFAAGAGSKLREAKDLLPVLLIAYSAMCGTGIAGGQINVRAPLPEGETLSAEATAEVIASYLAKQMTPQQFAAAVRSEVLPWEPSGQTRQEILAAYFQRGREMLDQKRYDRALPLFKEVYELDAEYPKVNKAIVLCLVQTNDPLTALPHLAKAREQMPSDPDHARLEAQLVRKVYAGGDHAGALALAEDFLSKGDVEPAAARSDLMAYQAASLFQLARYPKAEAAARACIKSFPGDDRGWYWLAKALNKQEKYAELLAAAQKASELDPKDADSCLLLARALQETRKYRQAVHAFERARSLLGGQTPSESFFTNLSYCYAKLNNAAMCAQVAGEGLKFYPGDEMLQKNYKAGYKAQLKK